MSAYSVYAGLSRNTRGALWMLASAVTFTVMTLLIKFLGRDYPAALQTFYRQLASLLVMLPMILRNPRVTFRTTRPGVLLFRSVAGMIGMILAFYAYQKLPLADANALSFTRTLWLVPLAAFVLKEKVGPRRVCATLIGFLGALLMVQPQAQSEMSKISVVPNPYICSAPWERRTLYATGRGDRKIDFIHLPAQCTVRIYILAGALVKTLVKDTGPADGALSWNLVSDDGMDIAFGLYIYHVESDGVGEHTGKVAVIK